MALSIRNRRVEHLARDLARRSGENMTQAIERSLEERIARMRNDKEMAAKLRKLRRIVRSISRLPDLDTRTVDKILAYDEYGLPR